LGEQEDREHPDRAGHQREHPDEDPAQGSLHLREQRSEHSGIVAAPEGADGVLLKASCAPSDEGNMEKRAPAADGDDDMWVWRAPAKDDAVEPAPTDDEPAVEDSWYQVLSRLRRKESEAN
jgi:hypothetical protein